MVLVRKTLLVLTVLLAIVLAAGSWMYRGERLGAALFNAAENGDMVKVKAALHEGADVNRHFEIGDGLASVIVDRVLRRGSGCGMHDKTPGDTPLMCAAFHQDLRMVEMLLQYGAQTNGCNIHGDTPLARAVDRKSKPITEILIKHGADIYARDEDGESVVQYSSRIHFEDLIALRDKITSSEAHN